MNENELMIDEEMPEDPFFEIHTKQDVDDIINKLDGQLWKIYEMNMLLDQRKIDIGTSAARTTPKREIKMIGQLKSPVSSVIKMKDRIIGNFSVRKKRQSELTSNIRSRKRRSKML